MNKIWNLVANIKTRNILNNVKTVLNEKKERNQKNAVLPQEHFLS